MRRCSSYATYNRSVRALFFFLHTGCVVVDSVSQRVTESRSESVACGRCLLCGGGGLVTAALVPLYSYGHADDLADDLPVRVALSRGLFFRWAISKFYSCSQLFT